MIAIVDYGMGNLRSVQKAFESIGEEVIITDDIEILRKSSGIILPGVGAFPEAMENLNKKSLIEVLINCANKGKPILGICLGMQILLTKGYEVKKCLGLNLIKGQVKKLYGDVKIPHMGWNSLNLIKSCELLENIKKDSYVYFVHSFYVELFNKDNLNADSLHGINIPAIISSGNIFGVQFHPEKSGELGIDILKNFSKICKRGMEN